MKYLIVFLCLFFGFNVQAATTEGIAYDPVTRVVKQNDLKEQFANIRVTSTITNDSLSANTVVFSSSAKALGSIAPGNSGDVLTSAGAGVAPSFNPASGLNNWKNSGTTNSTLAGIAYPYAVVATNSVTVGADGSIGVITLSSTNADHVVTLTVDSDGHLTGQIDSGTVYTIVPPTGGGGDTLWTNTVGSLIAVVPSIPTPTIIAYSFLGTNDIGTDNPNNNSFTYLSKDGYGEFSTDGTGWIEIDPGSDYFSSPTIAISDTGSPSNWKAKLEPYLLTLGTNQITATNDTLLLNGVVVGGGVFETNVNGVITASNVVVNTGFRKMVVLDDPTARWIMYTDGGVDQFGALQVIDPMDSNHFSDIEIGRIFLSNAETVLNPRRAPGSDAAYIFDTTQDWDNDSEFTIRNHGTNIFTLKGSAGLDVQGTNPYMAGFNPNNNDAFELDPFNLAISPGGVATTRLTPTQAPSATPAYLFDTTQPWVGSDPITSFRNTNGPVTEIFRNSIRQHGDVYALQDGTPGVYGRYGTGYAEIYTDSNQILLDSGNDNYFGGRPVIGISTDTGSTFPLTLDPTQTPGGTPAYLFNTTGDWDSDSMFTVQDHGTNLFTLAGDGSASIFAHSGVSIFGIDPVNGGFFRLPTDSTIFANVAPLYFSLTKSGGTPILELTPNTTTGSTPAYRFDTVQSWNDTDLITRYYNNGTNIGGIFGNGGVFIAGTTNQVVFGATNTAPVSSVAPTKWISVQVSGESTVYRLPLYQ